MGRIEVWLQIEDADKNKAKTVLDKVDALLQANPDIKLGKFDFTE